MALQAPLEQTYFQPWTGLIRCLLASTIASMDVIGVALIIYDTGFLLFLVGTAAWRSRIQQYSIYVRKKFEMYLLVLKSHFLNILKGDCRNLE